MALEHFSSEENSSTSRQSTSRQVAEKLMDVHNEDEVADVITNHYKGSDIEWKDFDTKQVSTIVRNVSNEDITPEKALTEIITNAIDATLLKKYYEEYSSEDDILEMEYDDKLDIESYEDCESVFDLSEERIELVANGVDPSEQTVPEGAPFPSITIKDEGHGQKPENFKNTFLNLLGARTFKKEWPFMQGQFGLGSATTMKFTGSKGYRLIVSSSMNDKERWGFTVIKWSEDGETAQYLTIDGDIPEFKGKFDSKKYGTIVKIYNYRLDSVKGNGIGAPKSSLADRHFFGRMVRDLWYTPISIQIRDERVENRVFEEREFKGGLTHLKEEHNGLYKSMWTVEHDFGKNLGKLPITFVLFKKSGKLDEEDNVYRNDKGLYATSANDSNVYHILNGQTHAQMSHYFMRYRCNLQRVYKDVLVIVDYTDVRNIISDMTNIMEDDIFGTDRESFGSHHIVNHIKEELKEVIKEQEVITEEEERRKRQKVENSLEDVDEDMLNDVLEIASHLEKYLQSGDVVNIQDPKGDIEDFDPPYIPTKLNIITKIRNGEIIQTWDDSKGIYEHRQPINMDKSIRFELDAPNDYFERDEDSGSLRITPKDVWNQKSLANGVLRLKTTAVEQADVGDTIPVTVEVTRPDDSPLNQTFHIKYLEKQEPDKKEKTEKDKNNIMDVDLPKWKKITKEDWDSYPEPFNEREVVRVHGSDREDLELLINFDAGPMQHFRAKYNLKEVGKKYIENRWQMSIRFIASCLYVEYAEVQDDSYNANRKVQEAMTGVAQPLLALVVDKDKIKNQLTY